MNEPVYDTLRMRKDDVDALLSENREKDNSGSSNRSSKRWDMRQQKAIITVIEEGGMKRNLAVVPRNLSSEGIGFFHGGFMHIGTPCYVTLRSSKGLTKPIRGTIKRCIHKKGRLHEIGVLFNEPISPRDYFIDVGDAPLFNSEAVDVANLRGTALVISESAAERQLFASHFDNSGMIITSAKNATEAIDKLVNEDPDMIFADTMLSDMEWHEFIKALRENGFVGPIVLLAAQVDQTLRVTAITLGANEVIFKPIDASILHRAAAEYLLTTQNTSSGLQPMISTLDPSTTDRDAIREYVDELQGHAVALHHAIKEGDIDTLKRVFATVGSTADQFGFAPLANVGRDAQSVMDNPDSLRMLKLRAYEVMKMCRRAEPPLEVEHEEEDEGESEQAA